MFSCSNLSVLVDLLSFSMKKALAGYFG